MTNVAANNRFRWGRLGLSAVAAGLAAAVVNAVFYLVAVGITGNEVQAPQPGPDGISVQPVPLVAVIFASFMFLLIGSAVWGAVVRFMPSRAETLYLGIAVVALLLSFRFPGNYFDPTFPPESRWILGTAHVLAAIVGVGTLLTVYRRE